MTIQDKKIRIQKIIELLKFAISTDDKELIKSIIESVMEQLDEIYM